MRDDLTQEYLKKCLNYDPVSGVLTWKHRPREHFPSLLSFRTRNTRFAGEEAGHQCSHHGYVFIAVDRIHYRAHRLAWLWMTGEWPENEIDHINHQRADNRWTNLREATHTDNHRNCSMKKNNTSGFVGVHWNAGRNKWHTQIMVKGKTLFLGRFLDFEDAVTAREAANIKYGFHENHGVNV